MSSKKWRRWEPVETWQQARDADVAERIAPKHERPRLRGLTDNQALYLQAMGRATVTLCTGPAGSGKTYMACGVAAGMLLDNKATRIIVTRPIVSCGQGYGFRKGTLREKFGPVVRPLLDALSDFIGREALEKLIETNVVELLPLDDMRGASLPNTVIICDEAQNAELEQLRMLLTRFGSNSKVIVTGDVTQSDLKLSCANPFLETTQRLAGNPDISIIELGHQDVVRHGLTAWIDERMAAPPPPEVPLGTWCYYECPKCEKVVWYNEDPSPYEDVDFVKCWGCLAHARLFDTGGIFRPEVCEKGHVAAPGRRRPQ